jgi:tRNA pseudouridine32 synthase/23S rRNA pseudouridine746 synthase
MIRPLARAPLPLRNGVAPSYFWLQKGPWKTVIEFLVHHYPQVDQQAWLDRMRRGDVVDEQGNRLDESSPYFWGRRLFYYREIEVETPIPFDETVLFQDQHILVVDKPHFLPVIPTGRFLRETLLVRLRDRLDLPDLTPIHRLDRETAGVMVFSTNRHSRGAYQSLFQQRSVHKEYQALAPHLENYTGPFWHRSRMEPGTPFFRMQEVDGEPNSETMIEIVERLGDVSRYRLLPTTGRKHQLRVHMAALGVSIINDAFYPDALPCKQDDTSSPLKLLARAISFTDPLSSDVRCFESSLTLELG